MKLTLAALVSFFIVSCSSFTGTGPPLQGTVKTDNSEAARLYQAAKATEAQRDYKKSLKSYRRLCQRYPSDKRAAECRFQIATLLENLGEQRQAFDSYQTFIERHPDDPLYGEAVKRQEAVAHAAAQGRVQTNFFGLKSNLERTTIVGMLDKVRDNAPRNASAPRAQYQIGQVNESSNQPALAIQAYERLVDDFPTASVAPDAQFRIGEILLQQSRGGNQDQANLNRAKDAYNDLLIAYPSSPFSEQARQRIATIGSEDITASYKVAEFYRKKEQYDSAAFYYQEVIDGAAPGELRNRAAARLASIQQQ